MDAILGRGLAKMLKISEAKEPNNNPASSSLPRGRRDKEKDEQLLEACMFFNAGDILNHVKSIEPNRAVLKKEIKTIMKLNMSQLEQSENAGDILTYLMLCLKYNIKNTERCGMDDISFGNLLWTFPDFAYYQMKKNPQFKFPWSDLLLQDFPTFKVIYHNPGLLGMMPKGKKYGGLAKALVFLAYLVSVRVKDIDVCIAINRGIYNTSLASDERREQWFPNLEITEADCAQWSKVFDQKFPKHTDIFKYFDQVA